MKGKWTFEDTCRTKVKFLCISKVTRGQRKWWILNESEQSRQVSKSNYFIFLVHLKGRMAWVKFWLKTSRKLDVLIGGRMWQAWSLVFSIRGYLYEVKAQIGRSLPFLSQHRQLELLLLKVVKNKANPATDEVHVENQNYGLGWSESGNNRTVTRLLS